MLPTFLTGRLNKPRFTLWIHTAWFIFSKAHSEVRIAMRRQSYSRGKPDTVKTARLLVARHTLSQTECYRAVCCNSRGYGNLHCKSTQNKQKSPCSMSRDLAQETAWPAACIQFSRYYQVLSLARNSPCRQKQLEESQILPCFSC